MLIKVSSYMNQLFWREQGVLDIPSDAQLTLRALSFAGASDLTPLLRHKQGLLQKRVSVAIPEVLNKSLKMVQEHGKSPFDIINE